MGTVDDAAKMYQSTMVSSYACCVHTQATHSVLGLIGYASPRPVAEQATGVPT